MSLLGESTLIGLLPDTESIEFIAREGILLDVIPTEQLRPVVTWALDYYATSAKAPTTGVLKERWGEVLADHNIDVDAEPEEAIEWAVDDLNASYVRNKAGNFSRRLATDITAASPEERLAVLAEFSSELSALVMDLQPRSTQVDMRTSADRILTNYDAAAANQGRITGLGFGLPLVDQHTGGIHPGEICVVAAPAKMGKSWFMDFVAYQHWLAGGRPALFTLENSIEMTEMRIACIATNVSITEMQAGSLEPEDYDRLRAWVNDVLRTAPNPLFIFNPITANRTPHAIVQAARANGADAIILDQLTFMENTVRKRDQSRSYELRDIMHDLKGLVGTGRNPLPVLMAHQIKREGIKAAEKTGRLSMTDMADSAEVERSVDFAFGLYASEDEREVNRMELQGLAARRVILRSFDLTWNIEIGVVSAINDVDMAEVAA
jgi:replicative DNA helicase